MSTSFIDLEGHIIRSSMADEHQIVKITEKVPEIKNVGKIVCGDTYSNIITFEIKRYYDNVDLLTKNINFKDKWNCFKRIISTLFSS